MEGEGKRQQALAGLKVIDLSWVFLGPLVCKVLGDHGAEVVKVEWVDRPDVCRAMAPYAGGKPGLNRGGWFAYLNNSKYDLAVDLSRSEGIDIFKRLLAWADVLVENYTPGQMAKWGLGYDDIRRIKPDIIMTSLSMQGQTGPYAPQSGFGNFSQSMFGFVHLTGLPGHEPVSAATPYPDFSTAWYALAATIGAVLYRKRTGRGQHIDMSQLETSMQFLIPAILDYTSNGRRQSPHGNQSTYAAPHGVYRCKGEDRWCTIAVFSDKEWRELCAAIGKPSLAADPRFETLLGRKKHEAEIDRLIGEWTIDYSPEVIVAALREKGIDVGILRTNRDIYEDASLRQRGFFKTLRHPEMGEITSVGASFTLSATPSVIRPSPCLGEHTEYVCREILHLSDDEIIDLLGKRIVS